MKTSGDRPDAPAGGGHGAGPRRGGRRIAPACLVGAALGLAVLGGCGETAPDEPASAAGSAGTAASAERPRLDGPPGEAIDGPEAAATAGPAPSPGTADAPPMRIPPLEVALGADGVRRASIDAAAFAAFCRAHDLPDPPGVADVDAAAMESIHAAVADAVRARTTEHLRRLATVYDGNAVVAAAEPLYAEVLERTPDDFTVLALHGRALLALGRFAEAAAAFDRAVTQAGGRGDETAAVHFRLGDARIELGELDAADRAYARYVELRPEDGLGWFGRGRVAAGRGDWAAARTALERAVERDPELKAAWLLLAQCRRRLGDDAGARVAAERGTAIEDRGLVSVGDPIESEMLLASGSTVALEAHVSALAAARRFAEAYEICTELRRRRPQDPAVLRNLASMARGLGRLDLALGHADELVAVDPDDGRAHSLRAIVLRDERRYEEAIAAADRALAADRPDPVAHLVRATALVQLRRFDEALAACTDAEAALPDSLDPLVTRAGILVAIGRTEEAKAAVERVLERDPDHAWARQARAALAG